MLRFLMNNLLAFLVALFFALLAFGISLLGHATPTVTDLEEARRTTAAALQQATDTQQESDTTSAAREESRKALERSKSTAGSPSKSEEAALPRITGELLEKTRRDVSDLLSRVRNNPESLNDAIAPAGRSGTEPSPFIMISFSMPDESVRGLAREAARIGATLVLRGMVEGSMQATAARLIELMDVNPRTGKQEIKAQGASFSQPSFAIDPTLFQRFDVDKAPTFIVSLVNPGPCSNNDCSTPPYMKVAGDVSLSYALRTIKSRTTNQEVQQRLTGWLDMLEERP